MSRQTCSLFVPGRIEFLGKHTDYAGGRSLVCAIDRGISATVTAREDPTIRIRLAETGDQIEFPFDAELQPKIGHWSNYPMTVARRVSRNFTGNLKGAQIELSSTLPQAAGLSSSSALVIAIFLALDSVNGLRHRQEYVSNITRTEELAGYLATIENGQSFGTLAGDRGVGTLGGSQDHTAMLCAREGMLVQYGFGPVEHERDVPLPADHVFAIGVSGVVAEKSGAARDSFNRASLLVSQILQIWRRATGRNDPTLAAAVRSSADASDRIRALLRQQPDAQVMLDRLDQFVQESEQIIPAAGDALLRKDHASLCDLVSRSQRLGETLLGNQVPETAALARLGRECGAVAASAFGAGFGGSVWALVNKPSAESFLDNWRSRYLKEYPHHSPRASFFITRAAAPVQIGSTRIV